MNPWFTLNKSDFYSSTNYLDLNSFMCPEVVSWITNSASMISQPFPRIACTILKCIMQFLCRICLQIKKCSSSDRPELSGTARLWQDLFMLYPHKHNLYLVAVVSFVPREPKQDQPSRKALNIIKKAHCLNYPRLGEALFEFDNFDWTSSSILFRCTLARFSRNPRIPVTLNRSKLLNSWSNSPNPAVKSHRYSAPSRRNN